MKTTGDAKQSAGMVHVSPLHKLFDALERDAEIEVVRAV